MAELSLEKKKDIIRKGKNGLTDRITDEDMIRKIDEILNEAQ